jgi:hypothetical protein
MLAMRRITGVASDVMAIFAGCSHVCSCMYQAFIVPPKRKHCKDSAVSGIHVHFRQAKVAFRDFFFAD